MAKIVLIDDEPAMRRATERALRAGGHVVHAYENGRPAIEHLVRDAPDLLITDIFMPEMEGLETIRRARTLCPDVPIIAISGFSIEDGDYLRIAEKFGAIASLKKPFRPAELLDLVARLLAPQVC
jgi:CheY-like chemotaxis protein